MWGRQTGERSRHGLLWPLSSALLVAAAVATGITLGWLGAAGLTASAVAGVFTIAAGLLSLRLSRRAQRAEVLALRDPLTGLPNRILLEDRIARVLERAHRDASSFAVLVVDLDGFKAVNDARGHDAGDAVLCSIAGRLGSVVRAGDTVARTGGDEFVVLSPGTGTDEEAEDLAGRMRHVVRRPYRVDEANVEIDGSIGWALYPRDGDNPKQLLTHADGHMYLTKRFDAEPAMSRYERRHVDAVRDFEPVLRGSELVLHYQPVIEARGGGVVCVEALVRRRHAQHGLLGPETFVPYLEGTPMIRALALRVVAEGLADIARWAELGRPLRLSVNVPYRMIGDSALVGGILRRLAAVSAPPGTLTLEVALPATSPLPELGRRAVESLVEGGVRLSLDDVGRGAPIAALTLEPWSEMKVDASLLCRAGRVDARSRVLQALVDLGHDLGLEVVATGVEHRDALEAVAAAGCDRAQGYYVQQPLPADQLTDWLDSGRPAAGLERGSGIYPVVLPALHDAAR